MASEKYRAYLCSREWGLRREAVHRRANGVCERCRRNSGYAVHHKTYARIYREPLTDLILLCEECHDFTHGRGDLDPADQDKAVIYFAGKISKNGWRAKLFGYRHGSVDDAYDNNPTQLLDPEFQIECPEFINGGPFFISCDHGCNHAPAAHGVINEWDCPTVTHTHFDILKINFKRIERADLIFAYIDELDCYGTLVELGYAAKMQKEVHLGFGNNITREDRDDLWMAQMCATSVYQGSVVEVWDKFKRARAGEPVPWKESWTRHNPIEVYDEEDEEIVAVIPDETHLI